MRPVLIMVMAEFRDGLRNRWIAAAIAALTLLALSLTFLGSAPMGEIKASPLSVVTVSLASLSVYLVPLIALMLSFDAIIGEDERGTLLLLLSYPLRRWQLVLGKFTGHLCILGLAVVTGYGIAGLYLCFKHVITYADWRAYAMMIGSTLLLGAVFLAIGYFLSTVVRERATAIGMAFGTWLVMIVLYDFLLLGIVLADTDHVMTGEVLATLIYLNPADIYRLFNLTGEGSGLVTGMGNLRDLAPLGNGGLLAALLAWVCVPLTATLMIFQRREV